MKLYGVIGTTQGAGAALVGQLVEILLARGLSVSTIRRAAPEFDVDAPGRDSHRHRHAGAREVLVASGTRWALSHELREEAEPSLEQLIARLEPVDLVLIEGYPEASCPALELRAFAEAGAAPTSRAAATTRAIVSDRALPDAPVPVLAIEDTSAIVDFILSDLGMRQWL